MRFESQSIIRKTAIVDPAASIDDLRELLRIDVEEYPDQSILDRLLTVATEYAMTYLRASLMLTDWQMALTPKQGYTGLAVESSQERPIKLPYGPVERVVRVYREDEEGDEWPISYSVNLKKDPAEVRIKDYTADMVVIEYEAGYGETIDRVPSAIQQGILQMAGYLYENRTCSLEDAGKLSGAWAIWGPFRRELI